jgi:hypothetical protein
METLNYFIMQKYNVQNNPLKETKILQEIIIITSIITDLSQVSKQAKNIIILSKFPHIK